MHSLKRAQKDKVRSLQSFTGVSESRAIDLLSQVGWQLDAAADMFFMGGGGGSQPSVDAVKVGELFDQYKEGDSDTISIEGIEKLCSDLGIEPTDPLMLMIAWQMKCEQMCVFTRQEWNQGCTEMGVEDIESFKSAFPMLKQLLDDDDAFRDYYVFCFKFAKEPGFGVRTLPTEVAKQMWMLTLTERFPGLEAWHSFLDEKVPSAPQPRSPPDSHPSRHKPSHLTPGRGHASRRACAERQGGDQGRVGHAAHIRPRRRRRHEQLRRRRRVASHDRRFRRVVQGKEWPTYPGRGRVSGAPRCRSTPRAHTAVADGTVCCLGQPTVLVARPRRGQRGSRHRPFGGETLRGLLGVLEISRALWPDGRVTRPGAAC